MKIEFSKEDIEQIRRIARQEIYRFWYDAMQELRKKCTEDDMQEFKK